MTERNAAMRQALYIDIGPTRQAALFRHADCDFSELPRLVLPSPSVILSRRIVQCTSERRDVFFSGPFVGRECVAAVANHVRQGCRVAMDERTALALYAGPENVEGAGVDIIAACPDGYVLLPTEEVDMAFWRGLCRMLALDDPPFVAVSVAEADQRSETPVCRESRTDSMRLWKVLLRRYAERGVPPEAFLLSETAEFSPRLAAIQAACNGFVADSGAASLLGVLRDPEIEERSFRQGVVLLHAGEAHTTAFLVWRSRVFGVYEQHTRLLCAEQTARDLAEFRLGWLPDETVRNAGGHGAAFAEIPPEAEGFPVVCIAGKKRKLFTGCGKIYETPGDVEFLGCLGLAYGMDRMAQEE